MPEKPNPFQRFRLARRFTQSALGAGLGVHQASVSLYESGARRPSPDIARRFLELCRKHRVRCSMEEIYEIRPAKP